MILPTPAEFDAATREDFALFLERVFAELNPGATFLDNFHIHMIADQLERVRRGEIRRLIINLPPRGLKSIAASVAFVAFVLGHDPTCVFICASYGQELAEKLARDCRQVMRSAWYRRLFPRTRLAPDRQAVHDFATTAGGGRIATSVGGPITGRGARYIIVDDPIKPEEAMSDVEREKANEWFKSTLLSRLQPKESGAIIIVMQRLHEDDLVGRVLESGDWEVLKFPAIAPTREVNEVVTRFGAYTHVREEGEALHEARESLATLAGVRRQIGEEYFSAQYQQEPAPPGGGMIKGDWFPRYDQPPARFNRIIESWDTASKIKERHDHSVCVTLGLAGGKFYILNVFRARLEAGGLLAAVKAQAALYPNPSIVIEDRGSGIGIIQNLKSENLTVHPFSPVGEKLMRMEAHAAFIGNGNVLLPREAPWLDAFLHELMMFPKGRHDDQVDAFSQGLEFARNNKWSRFFEWINEDMAADQRPAAPPSADIIVDSVAQNMGLCLNEHGPVLRQADGYFRLTEEQWASIRHLGTYRRLN